MVLDSNAVVNPLTVMIKPLNTLITYVAVSAICSAYDLTVWTQQISFELFHQAYKGQVGIPLHISRFSFDCQDEENDGPDEYHA